MTMAMMMMMMMMMMIILHNNKDSVFKNCKFRKYCMYKK